MAVLLYRSSSPSPGYRVLYEESIALFEADDELEAHRKAWAYGALQAQTFTSADGHVVHWELLQVQDVCEALEPTDGDGVEIYARHFRDLEAYRRFVAPEPPEADG